MTTSVLTLVLAALLPASPAAPTLSNVVDRYLRIQTALAADTLDGVKAHADALAIEAARLDGGEALAEAARKVGRAADLEVARDAFGTLSDALLAYADATKTPLGDGVRLAYCPMASKSWAQKGDTIANPYYGESMLTCGEFRKP